MQGGWQVGVHCNGDAGMDMVLNAYEYALSKCPRKDLRHRVEHSTLCWDDQFQKMKSLNLYPSFLIGHVYFYGQSFRDKLLGEKLANITDSVKTALKY